VDVINAMLLDPFVDSRHPSISESSLITAEERKNESRVNDANGAKIRRRVVRMKCLTNARKSCFCASAMEVD
jgi:hypothetical protein